MTDTAPVGKFLVFSSAILMLVGTLLPWRTVLYEARGGKYIDFHWNGFSSIAVYVRESDVLIANGGSTPDFDRPPGLGRPTVSFLPISIPIIPGVLDIRAGWVLLALAAAMALAAVLGKLRVAAILGAVGCLIIVLVAVQLLGETSTAPPTRHVTVSLGPGPWIVLLGGGLALVSGVLGKAGAKRAP